MEEKKKPTKYEKWFKFLRGVERFILRPLFPYKKHGNLQKYNSNYIVVCNHYRIWDVLYPVCVTDQPVHYMGKSNLWKNKLFGKFLDKCQAICVNRDGNDAKALMQSMRYLKNKEVVALFPEGTRNKTDEPFLPFKSGATLMSIRTKSPIIPIIQVKKAKIFRKADIIIGEPIEFSEYYDKKPTEEQILECDEKLMNKMLEIRTNFLAEKEAQKQEKKRKKKK
ncbi:MAG: 1-acyl-sn-glycerol-3-phosphate acyltransferase [Clostridia bacterium]|nr:1-acyl-sn-glycerol-3-phosphate acyltransferase [Clostridia bacterium]